MRNSGLPWIAIPTVLAIFGMMFLAAMSNFRKRVPHAPAARGLR